MSQVMTSFNGMTDRYQFDFKLCTVANGWAQLDTAQDASYFGNWLNPFTFQLASYTEGDIRVETCDDDAEFVEKVTTTCAWYAEHDGKKPGIDPGVSNPSLKAKFVELGLADWLH